MASIRSLSHAQGVRAPVREVGLPVSSRLEVGNGERLEFFDQFVQAPVGRDGGAEVGGLLCAQGLGDLVSVVLVGPGRIGAVEDRGVGTVTAACSDGSGPFAPKRGWDRWPPPF